MQTSPRKLTVLSLLLATNALSALTPSRSLAQAASCSDVFSVAAQFSESETIRSEAKALLGTIEELEAKIQRRREFNGAYERSTVVQERRRLQLLKFYIATGEVTASIDLYRQLFRTVELSFNEIRANDMKVAALTADIQHSRISSSEGESLIAQLSAETQLNLVTFGENYGEYVMVRKYLEDQAAMLAEQPQDRASQAAKDVLDRIGLRAMARLIPGLEMPMERPSLTDIQILFRLSPEALIAKLKRDARSELWTTAKIISMTYPLLNAAKKMLYKLPAQLVQPVSNLLGLAYDTHVRDFYLPDIERVIRAPSTGTLRLDLLRELNAKSPSDELLVTFARLTHGTDVWQMLRGQALVKADAEKIVGGTIYQNLLARMTKAEATATKLGDLSLFYDTSGANKVMVAGIALTSGGLYAFSDQLSVIQPVLNGLKELLSLVGAN